MIQGTPSPVCFANHLSPCPGERRRRQQALAPLLAPTKWGRGAERSEAVREASADSTF
jgi:hypothetical protein